MGSSQLASETYRFYKGEFEGALVEANGADNSRALLVHMRRMIGPGKLENPIGPVYSWTDSNLDVIYERAPGAADSSLVVGCRQVQARHQADLAAAQGSSRQQ
jgi:hypothetical protein